MASALIGALRVTLGLDSAAFEKGASEAERRAQGLTREMKRLGKKWQGVGATLSAAITAPIIAATAAIGKMGHDMAREARDMRNAAEVAGEGFEKFQRQAYAAREVGIEYEKLGDIFKDVRERVGEFVVNGGGPLQDAFDAVQGKVKLTVDELRGLSGGDALQLIVTRMEEAGLSTEEMSFVLESLGSDATALIPLLKNGGQAMEEFGKKASIISSDDAKGLEEYTDAQRELEKSFRALTIAVVNSGILDAITDIVTGAADLARQLSETSPGMLRFGLVAGGLLAALGPVVTVIGTLITIVPKLKIVMTALLAHPIILGAAALIGGIYLAWKNWDKIEPVLRNLYQAAKTWLFNKLGAVLDWVREKIRVVEEGFAWLYDKVVGNSWVPDMIEAIGREMAKLQTLMVDPAQKAATSTEAAFRNLAGEVSSLFDTLFPKLAAMRAMKQDLATIEAGRKAGLISDETAYEAGRRLRRVNLGLDPEGVKMTVSDDVLNAPSLVDGMKTVGEALKGLGDKTKVQTVRIAESFKDMADRTLSAIDGLVGAIKGGGFLDILGSAVGLFLQLGSTGLLGKGLAKKINSVPAYAGGTEFHPGGLALVGERGPELVNMPRGSQVFTNSESRRIMGGGRTVVEIVDTTGLFVTRVNGQIQRAAPGIAKAGAVGALRMASRRQSRRVG